MSKYSKGQQVQVQLGPQIEEAVIERVGKFDRYTVKCADGNLINVSVTQIVGAEQEGEIPVAPKANAAAVAVAFAAPDIDREIPEEEASAYVISDEWHGQIEAGNPFWEAAEKYVKANPDRHFRYLGNMTVKRRGKRDYQEVIDPKTGKPVVVSGMTLAQVPKYVHEERERRVQAETDKQAATRQEPIREKLAEAGKEVGIGTAALDAFDTAKTLRDGLPGSDFRR